jgi:hypothetical protein
MSLDPKDNQQANENPSPINLDPQNVPIELHPLIPYAEQWGITDDVIRGNALEKASPETLRDLVEAVHKYVKPLGSWLRAEYIERYRSGGTRTREQAALLGLESSAVEAKGLLKVKYGEEYEL